MTVNVPLVDAGCLADRLHTRSGDHIGTPAYTAMQLVDRVIEEVTPGPQESWHAREKDELRWAIEEWLDEVGVSGLPQSIMDLRDALFLELRDETSGTFLLELNDPTGVREVLRKFSRQPSPGQAITVEDRTYILGTPTPSAGTDYVAVVKANPHPG